MRGRIGEGPLPPNREVRPQRLLTELSSKGEMLLLWLSKAFPAGKFARWPFPSFRAVHDGGTGNNRHSDLRSLGPHLATRCGQLACFLDKCDA